MSACRPALAAAFERLGRVRACVCWCGSNSRHFDLFATSWFVAGFFPCEPFRPNCGHRSSPTRSGANPFEARGRREPFEPRTDPGSDSEISGNRPPKIFPFSKSSKIFSPRDVDDFEVRARECGAARRQCVCVRVSNFVRKIATTSRKNRGKSVKTKTIFHPARKIKL